VFFSELTTWKVRSERKKILQSSTDQKLSPPNKETVVAPQKESPKTS
jgi:hypothetical protein